MRPGMRLPSRLSNTARTRTVPLFVLTWLSISCSRPESRRPPFVTVTASTGALFHSFITSNTVCSSASKLA
jgi:hypothetical protein